MDLLKGLGKLIMGDDEGDEDEFFEQDENEKTEEDAEEEIEIEPFVSRKQNKIVNIHTASSSKVVISKPNNYDEGKVIIDNLKSRRIIIVNLNGVEAKEGQRILDFLIGAIYALEGGLQPVEKGVFILTPSNIEVSSELKNELSSKGIFGNLK